MNSVGANLNQSSLKFHFLTIHFGARLASGSLSGVVGARAAGAGFPATRNKCVVSVVRGISSPT